MRTESTSSQNDKEHLVVQIPSIKSTHPYPQDRTDKQVGYRAFSLTIPNTSLQNSTSGLDRKACLKLRTITFILN